MEGKQKQTSGRGVTEPYFKPKTGSVFPKKRKLVQTMIFHSIITFVLASSSSSGHHHQQRSHTSTASQNKVHPNSN